MKQLHPSYKLRQFSWKRRNHLKMYKLFILEKGEENGSETNYSAFY
jgi:hypothetical protein